MHESALKTHIQQCEKKTPLSLVDNLCSITTYADPFATLTHCCKSCGKTDKWV